MIDLRRKFFNGNRTLIYVLLPRTAGDVADRGAWLGLNQCVWAGPGCMIIHFSMNDLYPSCKRLFTEILGVADASLGILVFEAAVFNKSHDLEHMRGILLEIEKFIEKNKPSTLELKSLTGRDKNNWPITNDMEAGKFNQMMSAEKEWFIADTLSLRQSFSGIIPLLAFEVDEIGRMERLISGLELDRKLLTRCIKSIPRTEGRVELHSEFTQAFESKYEFLAR
jgi:hypothetical protein